MYSNAFVIKDLPVQILRKYQQDGVEEIISAFRKNIDSGCPCYDVELKDANRIDFWEWKKADNGWNRWVLAETDVLEGENRT